MFYDTPRARPDRIPAVRDLSNTGRRVVIIFLAAILPAAAPSTSFEDASARSIRAKLQKMVAEEDTSNPLTDQQIVHLFQEQGIQIARRTVAKYRDQLGILPARMRKRV